MAKVTFCGSIDLRNVFYINNFFSSILKQRRPLSVVIEIKVNWLNALNIFFSDWRQEELKRAERERQARYKKDREVSILFRYVWYSHISIFRSCRIYICCDLSTLSAISFEKTEIKYALFVDREDGQFEQFWKIKHENEVYTYENVKTRNSPTILFFFAYSI